MAFAASGFKLIIVGGNVGTGPGNVRNVYSYVTNDAASVVEADAYFDNALTDDGLLVGDIIFASMDIDGTPDFRIYMVTVGGADVTIKGQAGNIVKLTDSTTGAVSNTVDDATASVKDDIASLAVKINEIIDSLGG